MTYTKDQLQTFHDYYTIRENLFNLRLKEINSPNVKWNYINHQDKLKEYQLLNMYFGRQTGSSYWLKDKLNELNPQSYLAIFFRESVIPKQFKSNPNCMSIYSAPRYMKGLNVEYVFIDTHAYLEQDALDQILTNVTYMTNLKLVCLM